MIDFNNRLCAEKINDKPGFYVRLVKLGLTALYFSGLTHAVLFARRRRNYNIRDIKIVPVKDTIRLFKAMNPADKKLVFGFYSNLFGNIILFVPLAVILIAVFNITNSKKVLGYSFLISLLIEILQYFFEAGVSDIDDILLNLTGAAIGVLLYRLCTKRLQYSKS